MIERINIRISQRFKNLLTLVVVILNSGYALTVGNSSSMMIINIFTIFLLILLNGSIFVYKSQKNYLILTIAFIALTFTFNMDISAIFEYIRLCILAILAFIIVGSYSSDNLIDGFCKFMFVESGISCVFYLIFTYVPSIQFPIFTNPSGVTYYTCILGNIQATLRDADFIRNCGVFWEAGMHAAITAIWMVLEVTSRYEKKRTLMVLLLGIFTIYTTKSTTGYLYILLLIFLFACHGSNGRRKPWQSMLLIIGAILIFFMYYVYDELILFLADQNELVFGKLVTKNASYTDRFNGPIADLFVAITNPLGVGTGEVTRIVNNTSIDLFDVELRSRTSTLTYFFATFGIPLGVIVSWQGIRFFINISPSKIESLIATALFIVVTASTPLNSNMLFWILLFIGAGKVKNTKNEIEENKSLDGIRSWRN